MPTTLNTDYHGHTIALDSNFRFLVEGPLVSGAEWFESHAQATAAIGKWIETARKQQKATVTCAIEVLDELGRAVTIKGLHAATAKMLGVGEGEKVYPAIPWVSDALKERAALRRRLAAIQDRLLAVSSRTMTGYGRVDSEHYEGRIKAMADDLAAKKAAAEKMAADAKSTAAAD